VVGNRGTVGVTAQIGKDRFRRGKRLLGEDHPFLLAGRGKKSVECGKNGQDGGVSRKVELAMRRGKQVEELGAEDDAKSAAVKQEIGTGRDPSRSVEVEGAAGDYAMEVVVRTQGLIPGMENGEESDLSVQVRAAEIEQSLRDSLEENGNQDLRIHQKQRIQFVGDCEHQMEVSGWKQFLFAALEPAVGGPGTAFRTVPVPARVEARMFGAAGVTPLHMPAERFGAAGLDRMHHFQMDGGQLAVLPVTLSMKTENVGKF
jgi:hypothetical protein